VLYLVVFVVVVTLGLFALRVAGRRGAPQRSLSATALHAAALIALIRLSLFESGLALSTGHADWRQVAGHALLVLNAVGELALAAALSGGRPGPPLLVAGLILITSLGLGFAWGWLRFRPPFVGAV
jgi:hypothetical protein